MSEKRNIPKKESTPTKELNIEKLEPKKKKRSKKFFLLYVAIFGFVVYSAYFIINQNIQISNQREVLKELESQIEIVEIENSYLKDVKNYKGKDLDEFIENVAREDLGYVKNGERVFINVSGD